MCIRDSYFFVENEKTARKVIKFFAPEKKQSDLKLFLLDKYSETSDLKESQTLMTVSYTHLDVYKRQHQFCDCLLHDL